MEYYFYLEPLTGMVYIFDEDSVLRFKYHVSNTQECILSAIKSCGVKLEEWTKQDEAEFGLFEFHIKNQRCAVDIAAA